MHCYWVFLFFFNSVLISRKFYPVREFLLTWNYFLCISPSIQVFKCRLFFFFFFFEVKDIPEPVLGKVATTVKEKRHPPIMQY